ncbi:hypothetical protein GCM10027422_00880 [Hymenobacter arcticus]
MHLSSLDFQTWCKQHPDHKDIWYRELYPYNVFKLIDFSTELLDVQQEIEFNQVNYLAKINTIELQENGRFKTTFELTTNSGSKTQAWKDYTWNTVFQIVYSDNYWFVTVFAKNDPSQDYVSRFKRGNFQKINANKSLPLSDLLFRTLVLLISAKKFSTGKHNVTFAPLLQGVRNTEEHPQFIRKSKSFTPIFSVDRDIWVVVSFTEEKAHRLAYHLSNQCHNLYVVFCNPTYTRHHRCKHLETHVLSLHEFSSFCAGSAYVEYETQIRFLQNHLNLSETADSTALLAEITSPTQENYEIQKSDLMEAWSVAKLVPTTDNDTFHYLAAMNVINAWLSRNRKNKPTNKSQQDKLFRDMYFFKTYLSNLLTELIERPRASTKIFIENELTLIEIIGFQFSFHNLPKNEIITRFQNSQENQPIVWCGKRLQPIASLLLRYAIALKA